MRKILSFLGLVLWVLTASAQVYPDKPVKVIIPNATGQSADIVGRLFASQLSQALGQPFVVDNRPGAGGNIGTAAATKAPADGYTLLIGNAATHALNPAMYKEPGYNPDDLELVGILGKVVMVIAVTPSTGIKTLPELIAASKTSPMNVALPSTMATLVDELLKASASSALVQVPYKGSAAAVNDVLGSHVNVIIDTATAVRPQAQAGKLVPLAVTTRTPTELMPGVRPAAEYIPDFEVTGWLAVFVRKGTPASIVTRLNAELKKIHEQPDVRAKLLGLGLDPGSVGDLPQLAEFANAERQKWNRIIKSANLKAE